MLASPTGFGQSQSEARGILPLCPLGFEKQDKKFVQYFPQNFQLTILLAVSNESTSNVKLAFEHYQTRFRALSTQPLNSVKLAFGQYETSLRTVLNWPSGYFGSITPPLDVMPVGQGMIQSNYDEVIEDESTGRNSNQKQLFNSSSNFFQRFWGYQTPKTSEGSQKTFFRYLIGVVPILLSGKAPSNPFGF
eukprot:TRINITY_DN6336_c0_g3_i2.p1 TRINITY_DN6336_c0_g3~~TRINITY_DN6336_c0_g3_i2.p1  ORF type:complete len:191 (+),score=16.12 TRINITY_DN6336_c0_g3_i2:552-1124(+)